MAKKAGLAKSMVLGWLLACQGLLLGQGPPASVDLPYRRDPPSLDGKLEDWKGGEKLVIPMNQARQIWGASRRRPWKGEKDLSAVFYLCYDAAHLYLGGQITDDSLVLAQEGEAPERGDAIEVFLTLGSSDEGKEEPGAGGLPRLLDKDDVQLFLMPLNPLRPWSLTPWDSGRLLPRTGSGLTGIKVAAQAGEGGSYTFEARIPFHNFLSLPDGQKIPKLGFCIALDDRDEGIDQVHYMTWTGTNPTEDTSNFVRLNFAGPIAPLQALPAGGLGFEQRLLELWPYLLAGLLILILLVLLARGVPEVPMAPGYRHLARLLGVLLLLSGLLLPAWMAKHQQSAVEQRLDHAVTTLEEGMPMMERGTLRSYIGDKRDQPFLDLLRGQSIRRKLFLSHHFLWDLAPEEFGPAPFPYPVRNFPVRAYWVPLPLSQPQSFGFKEALDSGILDIVVSRLAQTEEMGAELEPLKLRLGYRLKGQAESQPPRDLILESNEMVSCSRFGKTHREMTFISDVLPGAVESLSLTAQNGEEVQLVGLTLVPEEPGPAARVLSLGHALGGVECDLRHIYPEDAGFELGVRGVKHKIQIPEAGGGPYHRMWLFYRATYPGFGLRPEVLDGEDVCRVTLEFEGAKPQQVLLQHQRSMFYERAIHNDRDEAPQGVPAHLAELSTGADEQDRRINVVYQVELKERAALKSLAFENLGPYPIRFRSVVFGHEQEMAPPDLEGSPLRADPETPAGVHIEAGFLAGLAGLRFAVYRNGSLAASGLSLRERQRRANIPLGVQRQRLLLPEKTHANVLDEGDTRIHERYLPLSGDWGSDAVLVLWAEDEEHGAQQRLWSLVGALLCLLSGPFLLLLFGDLLGTLSNLRLRLMAVVSVAALVPLAVLFVVLVRALEWGHESNLRRTMRQAVATASGQLKDRQARLLQSTRSWLGDLHEVASEHLKSAAAKDVSGLHKAFEDTMQSQLPPDWKGGFMRLEYTSEGGGAGGAGAAAASIFVGDPALQSTDTPLRAEPGLYLSWGEPIIGVRCQEGSLSLSVGRPLDRDFLGEISPSLAAVLCDAKGYPLSLRGSSSIPDQVLATSSLGPGMMRDRLQARLAVRETGQPQLQRHQHQLNGRAWIGVYDVIRDLQDSPRAILGLLDLDREATLELAIGRVPVRTFFLVVAGLLLVLSLALASVVTSRITRPIEMLEDGAQALRRGELDVRVVSHEGGQLGRLTEAFNNMAQDLRGRIQDLHQLNLGILELTSRLELPEVLQSAVAFFSRQSPADRVRVLLLDWERNRVEVHGQVQLEVGREAADVSVLLEAEGPLSMRLDPELRGGELAGIFPDLHSLVALPLFLAGRPRGSILLLFETLHPPQLNLELLSTMAAQTAAALENARTYRHAVEDLYTGAFVKDYFQRLVQREVALAQEGGEQLSLLGLNLANGGQLAASLGAEGFGRYMERVAAIIRQETGPDASLCRSAEDAFEVLLPGCTAQAAQALLDSLAGRLRTADLGRAEAPELRTAVVTYPEEGASAEFLFHALASKLAELLQDRTTKLRQITAEDGVVFNSPAMQEVGRILQKVSPSELPILLEGETGTGKEVFANLVHKWSKRAKGPLVKVHCAALPESLLQSELFGHEKGAFTGASAQKIGKFEQAQGGTIFLDEIGEVSLDTQVKLLRVLQEHEVDRVGGLRPVRVDVRVVAATNRSLKQMVAEGTFRADLYYRLQGMVATIPPLRERKSEIPMLVELFRQEAVAAGHTAVEGFSTDAMDELFRQDWPGNIRELRNTVFRGLVLAGEGLLERSHLLGIFPKEPREDPEPGEARARPEPEPEPEQRPAPQVEIPRPALTGRLLILYRLIAERGSLSTQDYVEVAGVSPRTGLRDLNDLLAKGFIQRVGRRRGARYSLVGQGGEEPGNAPEGDGEFPPTASSSPHGEKSPAQ